MALWSPAPVTGGKMPVLQPRASFPQGWKQSRSIWVLPGAAFDWKYKAHETPFTSPISGSLDIYLTVIKRNPSRRREPSLCLAVMHMGSKKCHNKGRRDSQEQDKNFSPVLHPPAPHREPTSDAMVTSQPFIIRSFSKSTWGIGGVCHSWIIPSPKVNLLHKEFLQSKSNPLESLKKMLNPKQLYKS